MLAFSLKLLLLLFVEAKASFGKAVEFDA